MKLVNRFILGVALGFLMGGCASTQQDQQSVFGSDAKPWLDQMKTNRDSALASDWKILDLDKQSIDSWGESMSDIESDIQDVLD